MGEKPLSRNKFQNQKVVILEQVFININTLIIINRVSVTKFPGITTLDTQTEK